MSKVLVVDDDKNLVEVLKYNLAKEDDTIVTAGDGVEAIEAARRENPDLILLDLMLPKLDGFEVCRILRKETSAPIIILSAKSEEVDKVVGLELGADDYVTKPFSIRELMARIRAMLRRGELSKRRPDAETPNHDLSRMLRAGPLEVDTLGHRVTRSGSPVNLTPKEFDLLAFLMRHRGRVFSRELLVENVWGYSFEGTSRTVDVHVRSLRRKIEDDPDSPKQLLTVHGIGYKFEG